MSTRPVIAIKFKEGLGNHRCVTFAIGGPLRGYYMDLRVLPDENDGVDGAGFQFSAEHVIRMFCVEHFPVDWVTTYSPEEFTPQIEKFSLRLLCKGRIEHYNGRTFFHEDML